MNKKNKIIFFILIILAFLVRFLFLSKIPQGLTQDEIAIGYNAYSILKTGKDEWGEFLPFNFKSVGDFKPPLLIYLTVPFVALLGKTEIATRLPVALFSLFTVILFFFFSRKHIFSRKHPSLAYLSTFLLALSPWHIFFSRSGFEAILGLFLSLLCLYFLLNFFEKPNLKELFFCLISGFIALISYHSTKVFLPLVCLILLSFNFKQFRKFIINQWKHNQKKLILFFIFTILLIGFFLKNYIFGPGLIRAKMTFLSVDYEYQRIILPQLTYNSFGFVKEKIILFLFWFKRYLEYFLPNFYLYSGLELVTKNQPGQGVIYSVEYIFLFLGTLLLLTKKGKYYFKNKSSVRFILFCLLIGFLPASLANNSQHALRSLNAIPAIYSIIGLGLYYSYQFIKQHIPKFKILLILGFSFFLFIDVIKFLDLYLVHYPYQLSDYREYGWKEITIFSQKIAPQYRNVYVDHRFGKEGQNTYGVPYLFFLFYGDFNPEKYNSDPRRLNGDSSDYANFKFEPINWFGLDHVGKNLYVGSPWSFPKDQITSEQILYRVYYPDGTVALMVVED